MLAFDVGTFAAIDSPYPGLRAFEPHEWMLFFGRETHVNDLLQRLSRHRFLAVIGASGSGKSSLVRAGLLPALYRGYLTGSSSRWRIAVMRPGAGPFNELARALAAPEALGAGDRRERLGSSSCGLVQVVREANLGRDESLLLVVDQFEELFRFATERREQDGGAEALLFVTSLLEAVEQVDVPLYVVLTMRTDFLRDCARLPGLPEALNRSQYLVPALSRDQRQDAICAPLRLVNADISPSLCRRLLNDAGDDPGQLPVLQHALAQTFSRWRKAGATGAIDLDYYLAAGGMAKALNDHAQAIYESLAEGDRQWTERVFRCLTKLEGGRPVRRASSLSRLHAVVGAKDDGDRAAIERVLRAFASREACLLLFSSGDTLEADTIVDISHETLIGTWELLNRWVKEEGSSADWYMNLAHDVALYHAGEGSLWGKTELSFALERRAKHGWNAAWAGQYVPETGPAFEDVMRFLDESRDAYERGEREEEARRQREIATERRAKRWFRVAAYLSSSMVLLLVAGGIYAYREHENAQTAAELALVAQRDLMKSRSLETDLNAQLLQKESALQSATSEERAKRQQEVDALQRQLDDLEKRIGEQQNKTQQQIAKAGGADFGTALTQISALEKQLQAARYERDGFKAEVERLRKDANEGPSRDGDAWRARLQQAEADLSAARSTIAALQRNAVPFVGIIPQYGAVVAQGPPFFGRVVFVLGDVGKMKSATADLFVWTDPPASSVPAPYSNDERKSASLIASLRQRPDDVRENDDSRVSHFTVSKQRTLADTQDLGTFRLGGIAYRVVATGWAQNVRTGGTDVLSLVAFALPPAAAR